MAMTFLAFVRNSPIVLMCSISAASPKSSIFCGVSTCVNRFFVALLTLTSVACADSATATSKV